MEEYPTIITECYKLPPFGNFTIGSSYVLHEERMNDIAWFWCYDDKYERHQFHEKGYIKYFK